MEVTSNGGEDFRRLAARFRAAGKDGAAVRKATTARIQKLLARITTEQKAELLGLKVRGVKGNGSRRRQQFHESASLRGRKVRARREGYGLRATIARGIKSKVQWSGRKMGARVTVETKHLPPSQKNLPRHLDNPRGWRHPVMGNREVWAQQIGGPYFSRPIQRYRVTVKREIQDEINQLMKRL